MFCMEYITFILKQLSADGFRQHRTEPALLRYYEPATA